MANIYIVNTMFLMLKRNFFFCTDKVSQNWLSLERAFAYRYLVPVVRISFAIPLYDFLDLIVQPRLSRVYLFFFFFFQQFII